MSQPGLMVAWSMIVGLMLVAAVGSIMENAALSVGVGLPAGVCGVLLGLYERRRRR